MCDMQLAMVENNASDCMEKRREEGEKERWATTRG